MTEQDFLEMLRSHPGALESRQRFSGLLKDYFPKEQLMVCLALQLYDMGIHAEIEKAREEPGHLAHRFAGRLMHEFGTDPRHAESAASMFCTCYGDELLRKARDAKKANHGAMGAEGPRKGPAPSATQTGPSSPPAPRAIHVNDIARQYEENRATADAQYKGKWMKLAGTVGEVPIKKTSWIDSGGNLQGIATMVNLEYPKRNGLSIFAFLKESRLLSQLSKGQAIEFEGTVDGLSTGDFWLQFKDCELLWIIY
jgi:hypothetical protein